MILRDARIFIGEYNLSADHNQITLSVAFPEINNTRFGHTAASVAAALPEIAVSGSGFARLAADGPGTLLRGRLDLADVPVTLMTGDPTDGPQAVEFFKAQVVTYQSGAQVGQLLAFSWSGKGQGQEPAYGQPHALGVLTATGASTPQQLGAILAGESVYAALHVLSVSPGATLDAIVQSDNAVGFPSPTLRGTFPHMTAPGSAYLVIPGPVTDDWWRAAWTITGATPEIDLLVVIGKA